MAITDNLNQRQPNAGRASTIQRPKLIHIGLILGQHNIVIRKNDTSKLTDVVEIMWEREHKPLLVRLVTSFSCLLVTQVVRGYQKTPWSHMVEW